MTFADFRSFFIPTLCPVCGNEIASMSELMCVQCHVRIPRFPMKSEKDNGVLRRLWPEADVVAGGSAFNYLRLSQFHNLLIRIKYAGDIELAECLGRWGCCVVGIKQWEEHIDAVIPVPMNRRRKRDYGYNQCFYLAKGIAGELGCPVIDCLTRCDTLTSQTRLNKNEREAREIDVKANVPGIIRGRTILLVDDVITTGTTLRSCIRALLSDDSSLRICVFTLASAGSQQPKSYAGY